ncbi:hypothetical protein DFH06DRAFT_1190900 [Mycena polygramma]|nr:hypothetical protein DFH06DRAFT_1190900 [Mycena polygramma]
MKSFTTIFSAALGFAGVAHGSVFNRQIIASSSTLSTSFTEIPSSAISSVASTTTPSIPTTTGGYVVTGIYTTCLTLTFATPTVTDTTSGASTSTAVASSGSDLSSLPVSSILSAPMPSITDSAIVSSGIGATPTVPIPGAVFTTCLAFLPTPSVTSTETATSTGVTSVFPSGSASAVPSESVTL